MAPGKSSLLASNGSRNARKMIRRENTDVTHQKPAIRVRLLWKIVVGTAVVGVFAVGASSSSGGAESADNVLIIIIFAVLGFIGIIGLTVLTIWYRQRKDKKEATAKYQKLKATSSQPKLNLREYNQADLPVRQDNVKVEPPLPKVPESSETPEKLEKGEKKEEDHQEHVVRRARKMKSEKKVKNYVLDPKAMLKIGKEPAPMLEWTEPIPRDNIPIEEEPMWHWIPFNNVTPPRSEVSTYNSDNLRSIGTDTISTGARSTQWWNGSSESDRTMDEDREGNLRHDEDGLAVQPDGKVLWEGMTSGWATLNLEKLQGFRNERHYLAYQDWLYRLKARIEAMEEKEEELRKEIAYNRTVDRWKAMLAEDAHIIAKKKLEYKKIVDEDLAEEAKMLAAKEAARRKRSKAENVDKYIRDTYLPDADREFTIVTSAYASVEPIDNFILAYHHDKWEHMFRTHTSKYTHDWARLRFEVDSEYDFEYYDCGIMYPWGEEFEEILVNKLYNLKVAVASAPMFPHADAILWHMIYCNRVPMLVMLNQMVERHYMTCSVFFPVRPGEEKRFRYNHRREYIVKCVEMKPAYNKNGIERLIQIVPVYDRQKLPPQHLILLHMLDWPQEGLPLQWMHYVDICERIKDLAEANPVIIMSLHGCGRASALALSLIAAMLAPLDDEGVSIHNLVHGGRATKRSALTCLLHVYFWRMVHYELLFRWWPDSRKHRVSMDVRAEVWEDCLVGYLTDFPEHESQFFELMFTWEYDRWRRYYWGVKHLRSFYTQKFRALMDKQQTAMYQARDIHEQLDERSPYRDGAFVRRKPLRQGDAPRDPNRPKREYLEEDLIQQHAPKEHLYAQYGLHPILAAAHQANGMYRWVLPSKLLETVKTGVSRPPNYEEMAMKPRGRNSAMSSEITEEEQNVLLSKPRKRVMTRGREPDLIVEMASEKEKSVATLTH